MGFFYFRKMIILAFRFIKIKSYEKTFLTPITMNSKQEVFLSPNHVEPNAILTVRSANDHFNEMDYVITDETGRLIRKGAIAKGIREFKLCIVGFKTGVYRMTLGGHVIEKFTVI